MLTSTSMMASAQGHPAMTLSQNGNTILAELDGESFGGTLLICQYKENGELCQVNKYTAGNGDAYNPAVNSQAKTAKAIWVKSTQSLKPLCEPQDITITKIDNAIDILNIEPYFDIANNGYIEYYESATATKPQKIYIARDEFNNEIAESYVNGKLYSNFDRAYSEASYYDATVSFDDTNGDDCADIINFTIYDHYVITYADGDGYISFDGFNANDVDFTNYLTDPEYSLAFKNANGEDIPLSSFKSGDVVAVVAEYPSRVKPTTSNNVVTYYNLGNNKVTGTITEMNASRNTICIDGSTYTAVDGLIGTDEAFNLGVKGTYIITKSGKICWCEKILYDYAYVLDASYTSGGLSEPTLQFKILTDKGEIIVLDAYKNFSYTLAYQWQNDTSDIENDGVQIAEIYNRNGTAKTQDRLVKYKLSASGCLRLIEATIYDGADFYNEYWDAESGAIGQVGIDNNAVVFAIGEDINSSYVTDISAFTSAGEYTGFAMETNTYSLKYSLVAVTNGITPGGEEGDDTEPTDNVGYITNCEIQNNISQNLVFQMVTSDGKVTTFEGGNKVAYTLADGTYSSTKNYDEIVAIYSNNGTAKDVDRLVTYTLNADDCITKLTAFDDTQNITDGVYDDYNAQIGNKGLNRKALIFAIDKQRPKNSYTATVEDIIANNKYNGFVAKYKEESNNYLLAVFNKENFDGIDIGQSISVVDSAVPAIYEGESVTKIEVYKDNSETPVPLYFYDESYTEGSINYDNITKGSIIIYKNNRDGFVSDYLVLATVQEKELVPIDANIELASGLHGYSTVQYVYGYVDSFRSNNRVFLTNNTMFKVEENMYHYDADENYIWTNDLYGINGGNYNYEDNTANMIFLKLYNSMATDAYVISPRTVLPNN